MQRLVSDDELQRILERGLLTGKWSIAQWNRKDYWHETKFHKRRAIFPRPGFLKDHPEFLDRNFRDLEAFKRHEHSEAFPEHLPRGPRTDRAGF